MIVHGPGLLLDPLTLPCCKVDPRFAEPGLVSSDASLVTCRGRNDFSLFAETWEGTYFVGESRQILDPNPYLSRADYAEMHRRHASGSWLALEAGELTGAFFRDGEWHDIHELWD